MENAIFLFKFFFLTLALLLRSHFNAFCLSFNWNFEVKKTVLIVKVFDCPNCLNAKLIEKQLTSRVILLALLLLSSSVLNQAQRKPLHNVKINLENGGKGVTTSLAYFI